MHPYIPRLKNKSTPYFAFAALALCAVLPSAHAATLAEYLFDSGSALSTDTDVNSVAGSFTVSSAFGASGGIGAATGSAFTLASVTPASESLAVSGNSYFSFTLTPTSGYVINPSILTFSTVFNGTDGAAAVSANYFVRSSLDGFSANIGSTFTENYQTGSVFTLQTVDLSGGAYQSIVGTVEFRIYVYDSSAANGRYVRVDNVTLTGAATSAIPEPVTASLMLGGLALLGVFAARIPRRIR
ncbi:MAG: hypothetical protein WC205_11375 [Opitutaceae bacterium]|jgi:hypothetical protein